jgi:hypothetical protein
MVKRRTTMSEVIGRSNEQIEKCRVKLRHYIDECDGDGIIIGREQALAITKRNTFGEEIASIIGWDTADVLRVFSEKASKAVYGPKSVEYLPAVQLEVANVLKKGLEVKGRGRGRRKIATPEQILPGQLEEHIRLYLKELYGLLTHAQLQALVVDRLSSDGFSVNTKAGVVGDTGKRVDIIADATWGNKRDRAYEIKLSPDVTNASNALGSLLMGVDDDDRELYFLTPYSRKKKEDWNSYGVPEQKVIARLEKKGVKWVGFDGKKFVRA